jgi:signal transduction histidine kinase
MALTAMPPIERVRRADAGPQARLAFDVLLALTCVAVALVVHLSGAESVAANREDGPLTVALTVLAVGSLVLRRLWPLATLLLTLTGVLGLVAIDGTVGAATLGPIVAAYTAAAHGSTRTARWAAAVVALALVLTWFLDPVDLSRGGAVINGVAFGAVLLLGTGVRDRRERAVVDIRSAAAQERLRITRELHDVLGHSMSVMVVQAGAAGRLLDTGDTTRARAAVAEIEQTGRRSMTEMRHLLGILRDDEESVSPRAPAPTLSDVEALVGRVGEAGLPAGLTVTGERGAVPPGIDLAAYRIVQEALTNCLKHSAATRASVEVDYSQDAVAVEVTDDGRGPARGPSGGHGLAGMRERVAMYDGELSVGAGAQGGFRVRAVLPRGADA